MKKCTYCGKEYPDDAVMCIIDENPLTGEEAESSVEREAIPPALPIIESVPSRRILTERQMRIFEVTLICMIAFGGSLYVSIYSLFDNSFENTPTNQLYWGAQIFRESCCLALLWYILLCRGKSFFDLGLKWSWQDLIWSIVLFVVGDELFKGIFWAIQAVGLTTVSHRQAYDFVGYHLFGGGVLFSVLLFQFLNPFCEELIARAYLMTEVKYLTNSIVWPVIISAVFQASYHLYQGVPAAISHVGTFLIFSIYYAKTNRITPLILAHLYSDVGATLYYWGHH